MTISHWILLIMGNVLEKSCRENQNTYFMFSNFFPNIKAFMRHAEKYGTAGQATDKNTIWRMHFSCWLTEATDTHSEYVIFIFHGNNTFTNAPVFSLYEHCQSCFSQFISWYCYVTGNISMFQRFSKTVAELIRAWSKANTQTRQRVIFMF
jgi:hypothetical protein